MSAVHATQTLLEAGRKVLVLDVGEREDYYRKIIPEEDFIGIRTSDPTQHQYFLGKDFEGIPWGELDHSLTPPRQYMINLAEKLLWFESNTFNRMESLSYGGLGSGWGAGCALYPENDLRKMGLPATEMSRAYNIIAKRIGVAAQRDDVSPFCSENLEIAQKPLRMDSSISALFEAYLKKKERLNTKGIFVGKTPMAVLTERGIHNRKITAYDDMEFWADHNMAVYRSWMTADYLKSFSNYRYKSGFLVLRFKEEKNLVQVIALDIKSGSFVKFYTKTLILSAGVLGTARIVIRSLDEKKRLPILTNPYALVPTIHLRRLGKKLDRFKTSLGQLELFYDRNGNAEDVSMVSFYTYRSLLLFKLVKEVPINMRDALKLMQILVSSLVIGTINHPDSYSSKKYLYLKPCPDSPTADKLVIHYELEDGQKKHIARKERKLLKVFLSLGLLPLKKQNLKPGSVIHYAGSLSKFTNDGFFSLTPDGRIRNLKRVYVTDGSGFGYLPANGVSFTLMANAHRIAEKLARSYGE